MGTSTDSSTDVLSVTSREQLIDHIESSRVVLVEFAAEWCGPCDDLEPTLAAVASESDTLVVQVDIEENPAATRTFGVDSVPSLFLCVEGEPVEKLTGVVEQSALLELIEDHA